MLVRPVGVGLDRLVPAVPGAAEEGGAMQMMLADDAAAIVKVGPGRGFLIAHGHERLIMAIGLAMVAQEEPQPEYSMFFL
jgi:hypothetical protein